MIIWKNMKYLFIRGMILCWIIMLCKTAYKLIFSQPKRFVCTDSCTKMNEEDNFKPRASQAAGCANCSSKINEISNLGRGIKEPKRIPIYNKQLKKRLWSIPKYPFQNLTSLLLEPKDACSNVKEPLLVVLIHSSPYHFERRKAIRRTWTNSTYFNFKGPPVVRLFLFGKVNKTLLKNDIETEHRHFNDILQGTFVDSYYNLSFNTMMGLHWIQEKCSNAKVVIKVDDDVIIDTFTLYRKFMFTFASHSSHVLCNYGKRRILRRKESKWFMEEEQFKGQIYYPPYCEGKLVMMTKDVATKLHRFAYETPFFPVEDVYFYGFVMSKIKGMKIIQMQWEIDFQLEDISARECLIRKKQHCSYYAAGVSSEQKLNELWALFCQRETLT